MFPKWWDKESWIIAKQRYTCEEHDPSRSRLEIAEDVNAIRVRTTPEEIFLELRSGPLAAVLLHATRTRDPAKLMVARDRIELPTRGFSVGGRGF
jgi:hypothetical protein